MQKVLWILLLLVGFTGMSRAAVPVADDQTTAETKEQTLFIFGVSQNLRDSVAYVTDIVAITAPKLLQKGFFTDRDLYADQFRSEGKKLLLIGASFDEAVRTLGEWRVEEA